MALGGVEGIGHIGRRVLGDPLVGTRRALHEFPFVFEEVFQIRIAPLRGRLGPCDFESARDGIGTLAGFVGTFPAEALEFDGSGLGLGADIFCVAGAMAFSKGVAACDEGDGFLVVHRHAGEGLADVARGGERVGVAVGALGVDIDEPHLDCGEGVLEFAVAGVAAVFQPLFFGAPVDVLLGFPDVGAAAGEAEWFESHRLERDIAREDHQVGPGDFAAVFLFDGPEEAARLVEVGVVGPAVERGEALAAISAAAAAVAGAVGAGAVPCHPDEEWSVVAEVGGPPVLRIGHECGEVFLQRGVVEAGEFARVVEAGVHGVRLHGVLVEDVEVEGVRPPISIGWTCGGGLACGVAVVEGAFRFGAHG